MNHKKEQLNLDLPSLEKGTPYKLLDNPKIGREIIPAMLEATQALAEEEARTITAEASSTMEQQLQSEIDRLTSLREVNDHVRPEEIDLVREQLAQLTNVISRSRVRLDTLRLIWKGSPEAITGA
jgi:ATP-dependent helicase HepA